MIKFLAWLDIHDRKVLSFWQSRLWIMHWPLPNLCGVKIIFEHLIYNYSIGVSKLLIAPKYNITLELSVQWGRQRIALQTYNCFWNWVGNISERYKNCRCWDFDKVCQKGILNLRQQYHYVWVIGRACIGGHTGHLYLDVC